MKRRHFLATVTTTSFAGCFGEFDRTPADQSTTDSGTELKNSEYVWKHEIPGDSMIVSHGKVFGDEKVPRTDQHDLDISGGVFSLDVQSGDHQWTFGSSHEGMSGYGTPMVNDAVYIEKQNDVTSWPFAIEFDGTKRWSGSEGPGPLSGKLSHVIDGTVYLVDRPTVRAIDAVTGEQLWTAQGTSIELDTASSDTPETVYVAGNELVARDTDDGSVQWRYEHSGGQINVQIVSDEIAYATVDREAVIAVADGELLWHIDSLSSADVPQIAGGSVLVRERNHTYAFDATTGDQRWEQQMTGRIRVDNDRIYAGKTGSQGESSHVSAFALNDGTELWTTEVGDENEYQSVSLEALREGTTSTEHPLFVQIGRKKLHRMNSAGEVTQTWTAENWLHDFVVDKSLIVSADSGIYSLEY